MQGNIINLFKRCTKNRLYLNVSEMLKISFRRTKQKVLFDYCIGDDILQEVKLIRYFSGSFQTKNLLFLNI